MTKATGCFWTLVEQFSFEEHFELNADERQLWDGMEQQFQWKVPPRVVTEEYVRQACVGHHVLVLFFTCALTWKVFVQHFPGEYLIVAGNGITTYPHHQSEMEFVKDAGWQRIAEHDLGYASLYVFRRGAD